MISRPTVIAIDGPVASGKSTVAQLLARHLGYFYLDTGLLYRALTWKALHQQVDLNDSERLAELARDLNVRIKPPSVNDGRQSDVVVDRTDVSGALRSRRVEANVSAVSAHPAVRAALIELQRNAVRVPGTVVAGRDIGSVIFPDADVKIYLEAHPEERARRRLRQKGAWSESGLVQTLREIQERDRVDSTRPVAPLQPPADALIIDTDDLGPEQVVKRILEVYEARGAVDA
jgi:cytidylate kinase